MVPPKNLSAHDLVDVAVEGCGGKIVHLSEELGNAGIGLLSNKPGFLSSC